MYPVKQSVPMHLAFEHDDEACTCGETHPPAAHRGPCRKRDFFTVGSGSPDLHGRAVVIHFLK